MPTPLPPIYRDCRRLLVLTEDMVRRFGRYHKYTVGTELRQSAMTLMRTVNQAVHDKARQSQHVQALVWRVDEYKLSLQLCMDVGAFAHGPAGSEGAGRKGRGSVGFHIFEQAASLAAAVGKQCGGWWQALARYQRPNQAAPGVAPNSMATHGTGENAAPAGAGLQPPPVAVAHPASLSGHTTFAPSRAEVKP